MVSRNTANKLWISGINNSNYVKSLGEFDSNYIEFKDKKISRVNVIAAVINKYETDNYSSVLIDDGSSQISAKAWNEDKKIIDKANIGDIILLVGKVRQNNLGSGMYIQAEIIKKLDEKWLLARKHELEKEYGKPESVESKPGIKEDELIIEEVKVSNKSLRNQVLNLIDKMDDNDGISKQDILGYIKSPMVFEALDELLKEGEIFEVNGKYKLLK